MTNISTLRPGLLVSLKSSLSGNVTYRASEIEPDHITEDGSRQAKWETQRTIENPGEHERAVKVRGKARSLITGICSPSSFGLLCPQSSQDKLTDAIAEARKMADEFNSTASVTRISIFVIVGRVAADDVEAVRAINAEVRGLLEDMEAGLRKLDVEGVREAANKARALTAMLSPLAAERAQAAIDQVRKAARQIVKAGETAAYEIDQATLRTLQQSRAAFLDLEDAQDMAEPEVTGRAIDLEIEPIPEQAPPAVTVPAIEL